MRDRAPVAVVLVCGAIALLARCEARAQDDAPPRPLSELALSVARVAMNEAPGFPADLALIAQTTLAHGDTDEARLAWLRAHSSCVLGDEEPSRAPGNCAWTRNLTDSDEQPAGWPAHWRWDRHVTTWARTREHAARLMRGERPSRGWPCARTPITWGGAMDLADAIERGLVALDCRDPRTGLPTRNTGFVRRPR